MKNSLFLLIGIFIFSIAQSQELSNESQFLTGFKPMMIDSSVRLSWKMLEDVEVMVLERRGQAGGFEFLDVVYPKNSQVDVNVYRYLDASPLPGINYYRFKINTDNEDDRFSETISIGHNYSLKDISIIPNSPLKQANIHIRSKGAVEFRILNKSGAILKQYELSFTNPTQHLIDLKKLETGKYYIQVNKNEKKFLKRINIQ